MPSLSIQAVMGAEQVAQKGEASMVSGSWRLKREAVLQKKYLFFQHDVTTSTFKHVPYRATTASLFLH